MITLISWENILDIWKNKLWVGRKTPIESSSAMCFLGNFDAKNMENPPTFFGFLANNKIVGVNSGHKCVDNSYRSRGLWVDLEHRGNGIGKQLLLSTIEQAKKENCSYAWSYPRYSSWNTYKSAGFILASNWGKSETSEQNAYCIKRLD